MYVIHFVVDNQKIYLKDPIEEVLVANSVGYLYCDFLFKDQSNWKPELEKKVTFSWGAIKETRKLTVNNGQSSAIEIPFSVIQSPGFTVSIRGEALLDNEPIRITTLPFPVRIKVSGNVDTDINEDIDNLPDGTIETPRQIAEEALKAAEEAKRLSEDAVKNVDAYFQIVVDLKEDTKKLEWVADRYMDFELSTATEISVLKDKTNVHYNELVSAKEKINELLNSLSVIRDNFDSLNSLTDGLSNKIENLFGITDNLGKNSADIKAELLDIINNSINDTQNNLELLRDNLINYFLEEIEKSGLNLREILQGDYGSFTDSINEKVGVIQNLFSEFETIRDALLGDIEQINNHLDNTFPGIHSSIDNLFGDFDTVSSRLEDAKAELDKAVNDAIQNLNTKISETVSSAKEELTSLISLKEATTQGSLKDVSDTILGDLSLPEITSVSFEDFEISQNSDDWGALSNFDNLGKWISNWLNDHNDGILKYLINVTFVHNTTVSLAQDVQRIRNNLGELAEDLSLAQEALYSTEEQDLGDIVRIGQSINTLQNSLKDESSARESQDNTLASAINENKNALSILQENEKNISTSLLSAQVNLTDLSNRHNQFEETTISSLVEIKAYIDEQINSQIGTIINADY